jgi:hypothetical protein
VANHTNNNNNPPAPRNAFLTKPAPNLDDLCSANWTIRSPFSNPPRLLERTKEDERAVVVVFLPGPQEGKHTPPRRYPSYGNPPAHAEELQHQDPIQQHVYDDDNDNNNQNDDTVPV